MNYAVWRFVPEGLAGIVLFVTYPHRWMRLMTVVGFVGVIAGTVIFHWYTTASQWHHLMVSTTWVLSLVVFRIVFPFVVGNRKIRPRKKHAP